MITTPVFTLEACLRNEIPSKGIVINPKMFEYFTWIKLPSLFGSGFSLFEFVEIEPRVDNMIDFYKFVQQDKGHPWIRVITKILDTSIGYHLYRMSFIQSHTNDVASLYFTYTIQDDSPCKPYIYMERR